MARFKVFQDRIQQHKDRSFLKAAMAASALASYADGTVNRSERGSIAKILASLERLKLQDSKKALEIFEEYLAALESDSDRAEAVLTGKLERIAYDPEQAELVAGIALAVSYADGRFTYVERLQFEGICGTLGVDPEAIRPILKEQA